MRNKKIRYGLYSMNKIIFLFLSLVVISSACTKNYYGPAVHGYELSYIPKQNFRDTSSNLQIGIAGLGFSGSGYSLKDEFRGTRVGIHASKAFSTIDISGAIKATRGSYIVGDSAILAENLSDGKENFGSLSTQFGINLSKRNKNTVFRYLGLDMAYYNEFGQFTDFKNRLRVNNRNVIGNGDNLSLAFNTEFERWNEKNNSSFGMKISMGRSLTFMRPGFDGDYPSRFRSLQGFYKKDKLYATSSIHFSRQTAVSLGIGYNFR